MLKKMLIPIAFLGMIVAQYWISVGMISGSNRILAEGIPFRFKCAPIDPNDPFRGKFITLSYDAIQFSMDSAKAPEAGSTVWLSFGEDSAGYARISSLSKTQPASLENVLKIPVSYRGQNEDSTILYFNYPFERYYLEETKAPDAEKLYLDGTRIGNAYALVYLYQGNARIREVFMNGQSLTELLSQP